MAFIPPPQNPNPLERDPRRYYTREKIDARWAFLGALVAGPVPCVDYAQPMPLIMIEETVTESPAAGGGDRDVIDWRKAA